MWLQKMLTDNTRYDKSRMILFVVSLIVLTVIFTIDFNLHKGTAEAGVSHNMSGYAWSDTIGWISFNCTDTNSCGTTDYGVGINESNGNLFGYAWSSNIGWITFNQSELSGCPGSPCKARLFNGALTGWARALSSLDTESGGWNGWISFSGDGYSVTLSDSEFSGFAWGSAVVGWIDFNSQYGGVIMGNLEASLSVSNDNISGGDPVTLTWTSTLATECSGTNFSTGDVTFGEVVVYPNQTTNYTLTCENEFDSTNDTKQVQVWNTECADRIDNDGDGDIDLDDAGCNNPNDDNEDSAYLVEGNMFISAESKFVQLGNTTTIIWTVANVNSCFVTGTNGDSWESLGEGSYSQVTGTISEPTTYTLACNDVEDHLYPETQSVTVSLVPIFQEF